MDDERLEAAIRRCESVMETLPPADQEKLAALLDETRQRQEEIKRGYRDAMDALGDWRLVQKYMLFDREARRRND